MKKKTICALALCAALSVGAAPVPRFDAAAVAAAPVGEHANAPLRFLPLTKRTAYFLDGDQEYDLLRSSRSSIGFLGNVNGFTDIARALAIYDNEETDRFEKNRADLVAMADRVRNECRADGVPFYGPYMSTKELFFRRADSRVVSLIEDGFSYMGGVHGQEHIGGQNFDAVTGKKLALSDVCPDKEGLIRAIIAQLGFDYPDATFMKPGSTLMQDKVRQMVSDGSVPWTLDPRGVSFYFNPYVIGAYAEGIFTATILFSEHPELFAQGGYGSGPASYAMELLPHLVTRLSDSPRDHHIRVSGGSGRIVILFGGETLDEEAAVEDIHPVVVGLADGRHYLYIDCLKEGTDRVFRVYDLNASVVRCIGEQPMTLLASPPGNENDREWYIMADLQDFPMTSMPGSGFAAGTKLRCRVGSDGRIEVFDAEGAKG